MRSITPTWMEKSWHFSFIQRADDQYAGHVDIWGNETPKHAASKFLGDESWRYDTLVDEVKNYGVKLDTTKPTAWRHPFPLKLKSGTNSMDRFNKTSTVTSVFSIIGSLLGIFSSRNTKHLLGPVAEISECCSFFTPHVTINKILRCCWTADWTERDLRWCRLGSRASAMCFNWASLNCSLGDEDKAFTLHGKTPRVTSFARQHICLCDERTYQAVQ